MGIVCFLRICIFSVAIWDIEFAFCDVYWNPGDPIFRHNSEFAEVYGVVGAYNPPINLKRVACPPRLEDEILYVKNRYANPEFDLSDPLNRLDIFRTEASWVRAMKNSLYDLKPLLGSRIADFDQRAIEAFTVDGKLLSIPTFLDFTVLYYNKELLDKYTESVPKTWDELEATSRKIQEAERVGGKEFWGLQFQGDANEILTVLTYAFVASHGGGSFINSEGVVDINNANAKRAVERVKRWIGDIIPPEITRQHLHLTKVPFLMEKAVFLLDLTHITGEIHSWKPDGCDVFKCQDRSFGRKTSYTHVPGSTWENRRTTAWYWGWGVNVHSQSMEETLRVVDYLATRQQQVFKTKNGDPPTLIELQRDPAAICTNVTAPNVCTMPPSEMRLLDRNLPLIGSRYFSLPDATGNLVRGISPIILSRMNEYLRDPAMSAETLLKTWECEINVVMYGNEDRCEPCSEGYEGAVIDSRYGCQACPAGRAKDTLGRNSCSVCFPGKFASSVGSVNCSECPAGRFASAVGASSCQDCPAGKYTNATGRSTCSLCDMGKYKKQAGDAHCQVCSSLLPGSTTVIRGAESESDCTCEFGKWLGEDAHRCTACPVGVRCPHHDSTPLLQPGYWAEMSDFKPTFKGVWRCMDASSCPGGSPGACGLGRVGTACAVCPDGMTAGAGERCVACAGGERIYVWLVWIAVLCACVASYYCTSSPMTSKATTLATTTSVLGMSITMLQSMGILSILPLPYPPRLLTLMHVHLVMLDFDALSVGCAYGTQSAAVRYSASVLLFFVVLVGILACQALSRAAPVKWWWRTPQTLNVVGQFLQLTFTTMAATALMPMMCYTHPNSSQSVLKYPEVVCGTGKHHALVGLAIPLLLLIVLFYVTVVIMALIAPSMASARSVSFLQSGRFLFFRFRVETWWWGCVMLLRALLLSLAPVVATDDANAQMLMILLVLVVFLALQVFFWPWKAPALNVLDAIISVTLLLVVVVVNSMKAEGAESSPATTAVLLTIVSCVYGCCFMVVIAALGSLVQQGPMARISSGFLLKAAPDTEALAYLFQTKTAEAVTRTQLATFQRILADLPIYDLWLIERIVTILNNTGVVIGHGRLAWSIQKSARMSFGDMAAKEKSDSQQSATAEEQVVQECESEIQEQVVQKHDFGTPEPRSWDSDLEAAHGSKPSPILRWL